MSLGSGSCRAGLARTVGIIALTSALISWTAAAIVPAPAQAPAQKPPVEEEEKNPPKLKPVPRVEGEEPEKSRPAPPSQASTPRLADLAQAAEQAANPVLRKLFRDLEVPYDIVVWRDGHATKVEPVSTYIGTPAPASGSVNLRSYDEHWRPGSMHPVPLNEIRGIEHYEERALARVAELLKETSKAGTTPVPLEDRLRAAEMILQAVCRFHDGARNGASWQELGKRLQQRLVDVLVERLHLNAQRGEWGQAHELAGQIIQAHSEPGTRQRVAQELVHLVQQALDRKDYRLCRERFQVLEAELSDTPACRALSQRLQQQALTLIREAGERKSRGDDAGAAELVSQANLLWPQLAELRDYRLRQAQGSELPLGVGVHDLPVNFSPATAITDSEKQAVELLFESLVQNRTDSNGMEVYTPVVTQGWPQVIPLGRAFRLARDAYWSNGDLVTAADVLATLRLLKSPDLEGFNSAWSDLLEGPLPSQDPFQVGLRLHQGYLEPLSLMTFKILPSSVNLARADDPQFARNPLGSGPYMLRPSQDQGSVTFVANPYYSRAGRPGQPFIREIQFLRSENPAADFAAGRLQLLPDAPTEVLQALNSVEHVSHATYRNRRVYFLAVNHRVPALRDVALRKAIAHAINRDRILNDVFRSFLKDSPNRPHRALNGPYPPDSWASNPDLGPLFDETKARGFVAGRAGSPSIRLQLKYPFDPEEHDVRVQRACEAIRDQIASLKIGIELDLVPVPPRQLHHDVEIDHDYQLAYYHFDYPDELYWLWPLFDPSPRALDRGGTNYLGYENDSELEGEFRSAMVHRDFARVRQSRRAVHDLIRAKMPLIPLWQLDTHIAFSKDLFRTAPSDINPLLVFSRAQEWKRERQ